jgi:hypothetical protein
LGQETTIPRGDSLTVLGYDAAAAAAQIIPAKGIVVAPARGCGARMLGDL